MNIPHLAQRLNKIEPFTNFSIGEIERIINTGTISNFGKDQIIFQEDEPTAGMYVLLQGQVQLCKISIHGQISILSVIHPVIMFNEVSALDGGPNPVTSMAVQDSIVWHIPSNKLQELILQYPYIGLGLLRIISKRNRKLVSLFQDLSFRPLLSRTAKILLEISADGTQKINRKEYPNYHLAARLSTVPEAFSRCLQTFRREKMIQSDTHKIEILDPKGLQKIAMIDLNSD